MTVAVWVASAAASRPIPFRQDAVAGGVTLSGALLIAVALLAVVAFAAWHARRRGWLDRWVGPAPTPRGRLLEIEQVLRLSPQTTLYRVVHDGEAMLVVESKVHARIERATTTVARVQAITEECHDDA